MHVKSPMQRIPVETVDITRSGPRPTGIALSVIWTQINYFTEERAAVQQTDVAVTQPRRGTEHITAICVLRPGSPGPDMTMQIWNKTDQDHGILWQLDANLHGCLKSSQLVALKLLYDWKFRCSRLS